MTALASTQPGCTGTMLARYCHASRPPGAPLACQEPCSATVNASPNPMPIGNGSHVYLDLTDSTARGKPRNPRGTLITSADFDMTASAPDPTAVVGSWDNPNMWDVCACQAATVGMPLSACSRIESLRGSAPR